MDAVKMCKVCKVKPAVLKGKCATHGATIKQEKFARAVVATNDLKRAAIEAYNPKYPSEQASAVIRHPIVRARIQELLDEIRPDWRKDAANLYKQQIEKAMTGQMKDADVLSLLKFTAAIEGWKAPTQVDQRVVKVDLSKLIPND